MKGTQLWQGTGSPLIEGRSRQLGPFWRPWLSAAFAAAALCVGVSWAWFGSYSGLFFALCSLAGAAVGVWFGRAAGSRRPWAAGVLFALMIDVVAFVVLRTWFGWAAVVLARI